MSHATHQEKVSRRFSAASADYDGAAHLQVMVAGEVLARVPAHAPAHHILDAGCGTGRLLHRIRQRWPAAHLVGLDLAPGMIAQARNRLDGDPALQLVVGDAATFQGGPFDLILSSSALHWLRPLDAGLANLFSLLRPGGFLVAGLMTHATLGELRTARHAIAPHKKAPGHLPTLDHIRQALPGGRLHLLQETRWAERYPSARDLLHNLHGLGVTGGDLAHAELPLTRRELTALAAYYDQHFADGKSGVTATFSVGYMVVEHP